jgi:GH25 family lysozyme M1 (1,4-beta-N-acetylmuramidase)
VLAAFLLGAAGTVVTFILHGREAAMTDLIIADVSEFQGAVDWATYAATNPAAIARVCYGTSHTDLQWSANKAGMRAHLTVRGFYQYVVAAQDITAQARAFAALVGTLQPGEFVVADIEEGAGDQTARAATWQQIVHAAIGGEEWDYSGASFGAAHLRNFVGMRFVWVAAYQANEPAAGHELWQFTDRRAFPGIHAPCDASVFHGTVAQLAFLINPSAPQPTPAPVPSPTDPKESAVLLFQDSTGIYFLTGAGTVHVPSVADVTLLRSLGVPFANPLSDAFGASLRGTP